MDEKIVVEEVAMLVGASTQTINNWYKWKKINKNHPLAKLLPDYEQSGERQKRYWKKSDVWSIIEFKKSIPHGRYGILGEVTQKYIKRRNNNVEN